MTRISFELGEKQGQVFNCNVTFAKSGLKNVPQKPKLTPTSGSPIDKRVPFWGKQRTGCLACPQADDLRKVGLIHDDDSLMNCQKLMKATMVRVTLRFPKLGEFAMVRGVMNFKKGGQSTIGFHRFCCAECRFSQRKPTVSLPVFDHNPKARIMSKRARMTTMLKLALLSKPKVGNSILRGRVPNLVTLANVAEYPTSLHYGGKLGYSGNLAKNTKRRGYNSPIANPIVTSPYRLALNGGRDCTTFVRDSGTTSPYQLDHQTSRTSPCDCGHTENFIDFGKITKNDKTSGIRRIWWYKLNLLGHTYIDAIFTLVLALILV